MVKKVICSKSIAEHKLGNSLFQLATLVSLHKEYGYDVEIPKNYRFAEFMEIPNNWLVDTVSDCELYREPNFSYSKIIMPNDGVEVDGYFQSEKYFKKYEFDVKDVISLK